MKMAYAEAVTGYEEGGVPGEPFFFFFRCCFLWVFLLGVIGSPAAMTDSTPRSLDGSWCGDGGGW